MPTATELVFEEEYSQLKEVAQSRGWPVERIPGPGFMLSLPAGDGSTFTLRVLCYDYRAMPSSWRWSNKTGTALEQPSDTPRGSGYFHASGRICAPWNRSSYQQSDPKGPHGDWELTSWVSNPKTGGCTTLAAMALRVAVELESDRYQGRMG